MKHLSCTAFLVVVGLSVILSTPVHGDSGNGLAYVPLDHWSYQVFYRLSSLGLLPLHAVTARPITRLEAQSLVREAGSRLAQADPRIAELVQDDLRRLSAEFAIDPPVAVTIGGLASSKTPALFTPSKSLGTSSIGVQLAPSGNLLVYGRAVGGGAAGDPLRSEAYTSFLLGSVLGQLGLTSVSWGPSLRSNLLLSDNAGMLPLLHLSAEIPNGRITKVVASLERPVGSSPSALLFGTRLDWLILPQFRLGLSEVVVTTWNSPLSIFHLAHPLPVVFSLIGSAYLHDALGQQRNTLASVDFDWLVRPGVRLYGDFMVDDLIDRFFQREARIGVLGGLYLADPFRTGSTSLRLEYSLVTNGTYNYGTSGLEYAYRGRSLGHWLGPDGDDAYLEITHRVDDAKTLQLSYAYTRHGQGFIGQSPPGPQDWFLSGVVETRQTFGLQLQTIYSTSLETVFAAQLSSIANRQNVAGAQATEGLVALNITYRWSMTDAPSFSQEPSATSEPPLWAGPPLSSKPGRITLREWSSTSSSQGPLGPPPTASFVGVEYRGQLGRFPFSIAYDGTSQGNQMLWSADLRYPVMEFVHGTVSLLGGWEGIQFTGSFGSAPRAAVFSGPRLGADFYFRIAPNGDVTPLYFVSQITSNFRENLSSLYHWTYHLGLGWVLNGLSLEAGYRGAAVVWEPGASNQTFVRWDGLYVSVSF